MRENGPETIEGKKRSRITRSYMTLLYKYEREQRALGCENEWREWRDEENEMERRKEKPRSGKTKECVRPSGSGSVWHGNGGMRTYFQQRGASSSSYD